MKKDYLCKIATLDEMEKKWNYEIAKAIDDKENWLIWKEEALNNYKNQAIIPYYGILDGQIISEATAMIDKRVVQNAEYLVDETTAYLCAFRTIQDYQGQGYFSKLFKFMIGDLKKRGYQKVTIGVEPKELKNKLIYKKYGFNKFIKKAKETYPDGSKIDVEYYQKKL